METFNNMNFSDLEMRVAAQLHDETIVEVKPGVSARVALKQLDHASLFGLTDAQKLHMASVAHQLDGMTQVINRLPPFKRMRFVGKCTPAQRFWAMAFQDVLGVSDLFYADASFARKDYLEQHYTELASHDTRKGRKAAKVVAARVMYALEDEEPAPKLTHQDSVMRTITGRMMGGFQNIPKSTLSSKIIGKSFDKAFIDELTAFKPKKP